MKLRIHKNSIRFRISKSDLATFLEQGILEDTIYFGRDAEAELTYALVQDPGGRSLEVRATAQRIAVHIPAEKARAWAESDEVGISGETDLGRHGVLSFLIEKDFACLDQSAEENEDSFPHPLTSPRVC